MPSDKKQQSLRKKKFCNSSRIHKYYFEYHKFNEWTLKIFSDNAWTSK